MRARARLHPQSNEILLDLDRSVSQRRILIDFKKDFTELRRFFELPPSIRNIPTKCSSNVQPENDTYFFLSPQSITVHWEPPPEEERNGQITGYKIRYRKLRESPQVKTTPANVRHFELNNLDRMSEYQVKIAAMTVNGSGPFSEWFRVLTYENDLDETQVPGKPRWITGIFRYF